MALSNTTYGQQVDRWEAQNDELPDGDHVGKLFEFKCWEAKDGKDYVSFGFQIGDLKVQRFYCLTSKNGSDLGWKLTRDLRALLDEAPPVEDVQVDGRTGPVSRQLVGLSVKLSYEERDGYRDVYINGKAEAEAGVGW